MGYENGKIYKLVNDVNDMIYIGSTIDLLRRRLAGHKENAKTRPSKLYTAMRDIGSDHFTIILIQAFPCNSKAELEAKEFEIANTYDKEKLYNTMFDNKHGEKSKERMKVTNRMNNLKRGCIGIFRDNRNGGHKGGYAFQWTSPDGTKNNKRFTWGMKRTPEMAYMACVTLRDEIYPLTTTDYLAELPFFE